VVELKVTDLLHRLRLFFPGLLLVVAGFVAGALFQRSIGAGTLLRAIGAGEVRSRAVETSAVESSSIGLPAEFVGKLSLIILAGQSNMSGRGDLVAAQQTHPRIFMFGNDYRWKPAREPVDDPEGQVDKVSEDAGSEAAGFGPGFSFALAVTAQRPDRAIGLVPCAKGDTTIHEWRRNLHDSTLYGSCLKRVRAASLAGEVSGLLFFQGEADALDPIQYPYRTLAPAEYATRFSAVVQDLRRDLGLPALPVVFAQIGTHTSPYAFTHWELIRQQQRAVRLPCSAMVTTGDLPLRDVVHFTTESYRMIGQRFAAAYLRLIDSPDCRHARPAA
jgi:hypothetical protein